MRILIFSDVHANLTALETVIQTAGKVDAVWCLGDLIGYGPDPNECVETVQKLPNLKCIIGNHDAAALNHIGSEAFNPEARRALHWTQEMLSESSLKFLSSLPERIVVDQVTLTHGSPRHPVWEYLLDTRTASLNFEYFDTSYCLVGHTHLPVFYTLTADDHVAEMSVPEPNIIYKMQPRSILNPGSVGQPRDRDPRTSFCIYDTDEQTWYYRRVSYDIEAVQKRMTKAGLPERHIQRLAGGW